MQVNSYKRVICIKLYNKRVLDKEKVTKNLRKQ